MPLIWMALDLTGDKSTLLLDSQHQAITGVNVDSDLCCRMASLGDYELIN